MNDQQFSTWQRKNGVLRKAQLRQRARIRRQVIRAARKLTIK
jgi:hypothetical protein